MSEAPLATILVVDDEQGNLDSLKRIFQREGYEVFTAANGRLGLDCLRENSINLVLCDVMMPHMDGLELLKAIKTIAPQTEVIMMTAYGNIERAVEAMKGGAYDFLTKPLKRRDIVRVVGKALEKVNLVQENRRLRDRLEQVDTPLIVGNSTAIRRALETARQAASSNATILLHGESGTGKELFARELHRHSPRRDKRFVAVNCAAIPDTLLDSELFGHEKGAFTGAATARKGRFELASGGTLFLDEIGELPASAQVRLLRVLQEKQVDRLGGSDPVDIDLRLVTATHRDLREEVEKGQFREDLFFRINVIDIPIPPLRERPEDIPLLANHFLKLYAQSDNRETPHLSTETMEILQNYSWPGNVRQLENLMQRLVVLVRSDTVEPSDLPQEIHQSKTRGNYFLIPFGTSLEEIERHVISETLRRTNGDKKLTSQLLGVATRTIYRKMEAFQLQKEQSEEVAPEIVEAVSEESS